MNQTPQTDFDFSKQLIKGKITELVFEQMFRKMGNFTVIPFGYESVQPELMQHSHLAKYKEVFDNIRTAPDFALVSHDKKEVFLVEVKYRSNHSVEEIKEMAVKIQERWKLVRIFIATPTGFYFDSCNNILNNDGQVSLLKSEWVSIDIQTEYLTLLNQFINKA
jgi:hypothetical protein